ncbi:hypothetical protein L21SP2_1208 [Salinispira pacifica]|uniref:Uncharacterized protein n=2 Tax=Salinispira pacifica TaxID=1307761 RepID=V5WGD6_9SPIO|nr:hypothetical protein L21SP2_1208 [Salinispira pacifica]
MVLQEARRRGGEMGLRELHSLRSLLMYGSYQSLIRAADQLHMFLYDSSHDIEHNYLQGNDSEHAPLKTLKNPGALAKNFGASCRNSKQPGKPSPEKWKTAKTV